MPLFTLVPGETVRKGVRTTLLAWIWEAQGDQNGSKSTVSVLRKATSQAPPTLFGQSRKWNSRKLELLKAAYESTSEMKTVAPPVAKFGMSLGAACPSGVDRLLCSCSMSSKEPSKMR